jgi:hypothetical protein
MGFSFHYGLHVLRPDLLSTSPHGDAVVGALQLNDLIDCVWYCTSRVVGFRVRTRLRKCRG